jgi:quercetin dioxygenase-like cupin family protein
MIPAGSAQREWRNGGLKMHLRGTLSETSGNPGRYEGHCRGHLRRALIDRAGGSVHQEVVIAELEPGGRVDLHLHAFEEAFYVLSGVLVLEAAGAVEQLGADDYVFVDRGVAHALRNDSDAPAQWFEVAAPQPGAALEDTVFVTGHALPEGLEKPYWRDHFDAAELPQPSGAILAGFDAANVGGAALKILVGPATGASQLNLMVVQYVDGGFITPHDHAFEEGFYFLEGEIEAELAGDTHTLRAGDYCWSGVGDSHALTNRSGGIVRWLETQVPQPPSRYQARFTAEWERFLAAG